MMKTRLVLICCTWSLMAIHAHDSSPIGDNVTADQSEKATHLMTNDQKAMSTEPGSITTASPERLQKHEVRAHMKSKSHLRRKSNTGSEATLSPSATPKAASSSAQSINTTGHPPEVNPD